MSRWKVTNMMASARGVSTKWPRWTQNQKMFESGSVRRQKRGRDLFLFNQTLNGDGGRLKRKVLPKKENRRRRGSRREEYKRER